ncbi:MAG: hypothetical protein ACXWP5_04055 [Bdellovibrionota bacterium]
MSVIQSVLLVASLMTSAAPRAAADSHFAVDFEILNGPLIGATYQLRFEPESGCTVSQRHSGEKVNPTRVPDRECRALQERIESDLPDLSGSSIPSGSLPEILPRTPTGLLKIGELRIPATLQWATTCDVNGKACKSPSLNAAGRLAKELVTIVTRHLGRLGQPE